jgi:hypothetical protein
VTHQVLMVASMKMTAFWDIVTWWWRQYAPLKRQSTVTRLRGTISQKALIFSIRSKSLNIPEL